jgi:hypothetical protein
LNNVNGSFLQGYIPGLLHRNILTAPLFTSQFDISHPI